MLREDVNAAIGTIKTKRTTALGLGNSGEVHWSVLGMSVTWIFANRVHSNTQSEGAASDSSTGAPVASRLVSLASQLHVNS